MSVPQSPIGECNLNVSNALQTQNTQLTELDILSQKNETLPAQVTPSCPLRNKDTGDADIEEDLSDESSVGQIEPTVQKYLPNIYIDVDLSKRSSPAIIDFYDECLKKYKSASDFIREEVYLLAPSKGWVLTDSDQNHEVTPTNAIDPLNADRLLFEENLDSWNICKPHDPLIRCIHSISDRLRIQQLVADPSSYLKRGGDDNHYDIDDPFFDDSDMYTQLNIDKSEVIVKQEIFQNFSPWSEDSSCVETASDEYIKGVPLEPSNFIAIFSNPQETPPVVEEKPVKKAPIKLFVNSTGWKKYSKRIPPRIHQCFKEFTNKWNSFIDSGTVRKISSKMIKEAIDELLKSIFNRMLTFPVKSILPPKELKRNKSKEVNVKTESVKEEQKIKTEPPAGQANEETKHENTNNSVVIVKKRNKKAKKVEYVDVYDGNILIFGKIIDSCNKTLRWIISACKSITNAYSLVEIGIIWLKMTLEHNAQLVNSLKEKIIAKLTEELGKFNLKTCKKFELFQSALAATNKQNMRRLRKEGFSKDNKLPDEIFHLKRIDKYLRSLSRDLVMFIQISNLSLSVIESIVTSNFVEYLPEELLDTASPYETLAKNISKCFSDEVGREITIPWQLAYAIVKQYYKSGKSKSLYENRQRPVVVLFEWSTEKAPANAIYDLGSKKRSPKSKKNIEETNVNKKRSRVDKSAQNNVKKTPSTFKYLLLERVSSVN